MNQDAPWYDNAANLHMLCRYLVDYKDFDRFDILHVLAKPSRWKAEFLEADAMRQVQYS